jgi:hypothetical protein
MKQIKGKIVTTIAMLLLFTVGCTDQTGITSPVESSATKPLLKLVELPAPVGMSIETLYTESQEINGYYGGVFTEEFSYKSSTGEVKIYSQLVFPVKAFYGTQTITQTFNTETASLEFGPSMKFYSPVKYTLSITGLDLSSINPKTVSFVYIAPDGSLTGVVYDGIKMDTASRTITVVNAQLDHFSRYGFVN